MKRNPQRLSTLYICSLFIFLFSSIHAQTNKDHATTSKLTKVEQANSLFKEWNSVDSGGAAIAVIKNGKVVFSNAYGSANLEYSIPNTTNTIFHAASLSKQFTAYAILLLEKEGKLSLDDDIRTYIPEVPNFGKKITLRHLASHTSGIRDQWRLLYLAGWKKDDVILNQDILDLVSKQNSLNFDPGTKLSYSNTGFTLLAEVVARVSGQSFAEYTKDNIFVPLEMSNSQFYDDYEKIVKNRAYSYKNKENIIKKSKLSFSTVGATNLFTTVHDLCKWAIYLNTPTPENKGIITKMNQQAYLNNGQITEAAMGQWTGVKYKGLEWFDHTGSDASFRAYFSRFPEHNSAVVILANTTPIRASTLALKTADIFLNEYYKSESKGKAKKSKNEKRIKKSIKLSKNQMSKFCGKYWEPKEWYDREIKIVNDTLIYYRSKESQTKLLPISNNEFKMLADTNDVSVIFEENENNEKVMRLNINSNQNIEFLKYNPFDISEYTGNFGSEELNSSIQLYNDNNSVFIKLFKRDPIKLKAIKKDVFTSSNRHFKKIEFLRNSNGIISGFLVSNGGIASLKYDKN